MIQTGTYLSTYRAMVDFYEKDCSALGGVYDYAIAMAID